MADTRLINRSEMEPGTVAVFIGAVVTLATAIVTGLWQWIGGRKKNNTDAHQSLMGGFAALLASVQGERDSLLTRLGESERRVGECERRVDKLERLLLRHKIAIPEDTRK